MRELTETQMSELTDTELDAVCGGFLNHSLNSVVQTNTSAQVGVAIGGLGGLFGLAPASVTQLSGQSNISVI